MRGVIYLSASNDRRRDEHVGQSQSAWSVQWPLERVGQESEGADSQGIKERWKQPRDVM